MKGLYEQAVLPHPFSIMGRALKPFSFGHFLILRRFGVGFVADAKATLTIEDIIFSLFVCSHTYQDCLELLYSGEWEIKVKEWGKAVRMQCKKAVRTGFVKRASRFLMGRPAVEFYIDFRDIARLFQEYIDYHTVRPLFKPRRPSEEKFEANAEWYEGIIKTLMGECGYSHVEVMNLCFAQALYEYLSYMEQQGAIVFYNERQEKQLAAILEKKKAKVNG